jgi:hypothetical protein
VENPGGIGKGIRECTLNGAPLDTPLSMGIPVREPGSVNQVRVVLEGR